MLSPSSLIERLTAWSANAGPLLSTPLGHGVGSSGSAAEVLAGPDGAYFQPDNAYFHWMYQLGPVGLWLLLHLLAAVVVVAWRSSRTLPPEAAAWSLGIALSTTASATAALVANYFEIFPVDLMFWVLVGILASLDDEGGQTRVLHPTRLRSARTPQAQQ